VAKKYCATCHNFGPSLIIIIDDGDQDFKKYIYPKIFIVSCVKLIDGWQLMMSTWHHGCNYNGVASSWKWVVLTKL
jgi:hypothetical protein